jgi:hypothetical protein
LTGSDLLLIGVLILSLLPILLVLVDTVARQGGAIAFRDIRVDFAGSVEPASSITIPRNIGLPGQPDSDSTTTEIIDTLRNAAGNEIVVVDLEEGDAWWETRLLVLCAGAARLRRPSAIVFVATKRTPWQFQGWAPPGELLRALLRAEQGYRRSYATAEAAAAQWALVPPPPAGAPCPPPGHPWFSGPALTHSWMAWRQLPTGCKPNELATEQFLSPMRSGATSRRRRVASRWFGYSSWSVQSSEPVRSTRIGRTRHAWTRCWLPMTSTSL